MGAKERKSEFSEPSLDPQLETIFSKKVSEAGVDKQLPENVAVSLCECVGDCDNCDACYGCDDGCY